MSRLRVVSYAINGRGMGHLVRQLAILRWVRHYCTFLDVGLDAWVLTSSEADTLARREGFLSLKLPSKSMMRDAGMDPAHFLAVNRTWVVAALGSLQPDLLIVDTFPGGSFGELSPVLEMARRRALVARPVRPEIAADPAYAALLPFYDRRIIPETGGLDGDHVPPILLREREELPDRAEARRRLGVSGRAVYVSLGGGGDPSAPALLGRLVPLLRAADWEVVVGAGPLYQGPELRGPGVVWMDRYVPMELLPGVDAAVSAGGYNSFHELMYVGIPTVFLPQPRLADDQAARVQRAVDAGAAQQAARIEDIPRLLTLPMSGGAGLIPENGARQAAARCLSLVLPPEDVAFARQAMTPALLGRFAASGLSPAQGLTLLRLFAGETPNSRSRRRQILEDAGVKLPASSSALDQLLDFLAETADVPAEIRVNLVEGLARRFPAARPTELAAASRRLFALGRRFEDWMGLVTLLRAIPTQRQYTILEFLPDIERFLARWDDLYDATRHLSAQEGLGLRSVAEVLKG